MPKKVSQFVKNEQPVNWNRAFWCGLGGSMLMMTLIDIFNILGVTTFSFEYFLGSLIATEPYPSRIWVAGFLLNSFLGGIFGLLYGYFFEYVFRRADARNGALVGLAHSVVAAVAFFPFFVTIHDYLGTGLFGNFGLLGLGINGATPILLVVGHLMFGALVGTFYGPVRAGRVQARQWEPGEHGMPGDRGVITRDDDHPERAAV